MIHVIGYLLLVNVIWAGVDASCNGTSTCCHPDLPTESAGEVRQITDTEKTSYDVDEVVGYFCENKNGHLSMTCQGSDVWSDVDRTCEDVIPFSNGSATGICFAVFNICLEVILIVLSTKLQKTRAKEEEIEMRLKEAADASRA